MSIPYPNKVSSHYVYAEHRPRIFTEEGQEAFTKARDNANRLLLVAGAFKSMLIFDHTGADDSHVMLAILDRMVEMGDLRCLNPKAAGQDMVYVSAREGFG